MNGGISLRVHPGMECEYPRHAKNVAGIISIGSIKMKNQQQVLFIVCICASIIAVVCGVISIYNSLETKRQLNNCTKVFDSVGR
jgi:TATA-binding protein-associated factor Taf7